MSRAKKSMKKKKFFKRETTSGLHGYNKLNIQIFGHVVSKTVNEWISQDPEIIYSAIYKIEPMDVFTVCVPGFNKCIMRIGHNEATRLKDAISILNSQWTKRSERRKKVRENFGDSTKEKGRYYLPYNYSIPISAKLT